MSATIVALALLGSLSIELFFVVSLIGALIVIELTAPLRRDAPLAWRLKWLVVLSLLGFAYVVIRRILEILPPGVI